MNKKSDQEGMSHFHATPAAPVLADRGRDFAATGRRLCAWLASRMPGSTGMALADLRYPVGAGTSNETILFKARWQEGARAFEKDFVARLHPGDFQLFLDPAFERQYRLLELIGRRGWVRVPPVRWQEADASILGQPFFLMERIEGRVPVTFPIYNLAGFLADATPREREHAWLSAMEQFTRIHCIPADEVRFMHRAEFGATGFDDEFNYWMRALDWTAGERMPPTYPAAREWLRKNRPAAPPEGLSWGDARIGNMIFDANFEVAAVLDWEQGSLAGGLQDLGWWLLFDVAFSSGVGLKRLEGLGTRQQTIDLWQERTGQRAADLHWYEIFGAFKAATLAMRKARLEGRFTPGNNPGNNLFARILCSRLELPPPADMA